MTEPCINSEESWLKCVTDSQWNYLSKMYPFLKRENVYVIDDSEGIAKYNCYAWAIGRTDERLAPRTENFGDFKDWFKDKKFDPVEPPLSDVAVIDGWKGPNGEMVHASRLWRGRWTSKLDEGLCITHGRDELKGSSEIPAYGQIVVSFRPEQESDLSIS